MPNTEISYTIALQNLKSLGNIGIKKLIEIFGSAQDAFEASETELKTKANFSAKIIAKWNKKEALAQANEILDICQRKNISTVSISQAEYPYKLANINDAPAVLYSVGRLNWETFRFVAIVGTRAASNYGINLCKDFIHKLKESGKNIVIVSGGAAGIDTCAHREALTNNMPTLSVLGHGLNTLYPAANKQLAAQIIKNGALLTEFTFGSKITPVNFARRNRIIAGLADATVVVESGKKGGSLITADLAFNYNREVYAFPGRANDSKSAGCNALIRKNMASLIENADDFLQSMNWQTKQKEQRIQKELFVELETEEKIVYKFLQQNNDLPVDFLARQCQMPVSKVSFILLNLEFKGLIRTLPGKIYQAL